MPRAPFFPDVAKPLSTPSGFLDARGPNPKALLSYPPPFSRRGVTNTPRRLIGPSNAIDLSKAGSDGARFFVPGIEALSVLSNRIEKLVAPVVAAGGFELVRVKVTGAEFKTVQIMAERPDHTMSAGDCATLSRALSPILEAADPIEGAYRLEVSSPGIDRPLTRLKDFHDWQGYEARIELDRMIEDRKKFKGVLAGVDGDNICIDIEGETETALIPHAWVVLAKLLLTDDLIRASLRAAKTALKAQTDEAAETVTADLAIGDPT